VKMSVMDIVDKILKVWWYVFGWIVGITLFCAGVLRISTCIYFIRLSDPYTAHFMNVGLLYILISLCILIALAIITTYSLAKYKK